MPTPVPRTATGPKTSGPRPPLSINLVHGGVPVKTVTVKSNCCADRKGVKR